MLPGAAATPFFEMRTTWGNPLGAGLFQSRQVGFDMSAMDFAHARAHEITWGGSRNKYGQTLCMPDPLAAVG
jgi:hypothetical protein